MNKYLHQIIFASLLLLGLTQAVILLTDPQDVTVEANEWAQFNCTVHCNYTVNWYMAGHSSAIKRNNTVPGLLIKRGRASSCTESNKRTHFFEVLATEAFNKSTFYCAANEGSQHRSMCRCAGGRCYSRPALLTVIRPATVTSPSQTSAGITEVTPSPSLASPTHTLQETASLKIVTMTTTVMVTVTPTPTNCPDSDLTLSAHMHSSGTQATSVKATVLACLGIAASIFFL